MKSVSGTTENSLVFQGNLAQKSPEKPQDTFERYNVQSNSKGRDRENNLQRIFSTIFSLEKEKVYVENT